MRRRLRRLADLGQVELDELLVELGTVLAEVVDDVLEVAAGSVGSDLLQVQCDGMARQRLDLLDVCDEDLSGQSRRIACNTHIESRLAVDLKDPLRRLEDEVEVIRAELLQVADRRLDLVRRIVLVVGHPARSAERRSD